MNRPLNHSLLKREPYKDNRYVEKVLVMAMESSAIDSEPGFQVEELVKASHVHPPDAAQGHFSTGQVWSHIHLRDGYS